jgi:hypothetical protein
MARIKEKETSTTDVLLSGKKRKLSEAAPPAQPSKADEDLPRSLFFDVPGEDYEETEPEYTEYEVFW